MELPIDVYINDNQKVIILAKQIKLKYMKDLLNNLKSTYLK